ncbi:MAG: aminoacyl-tRNA hydrolase [Pseudomonadota bacterium]
MLVIAGLGNPGPKYADHRHNIGFMAVDRIFDAGGFSPWKSKHRAFISEGKLGGEKVLLVKPSTFMNESGRAVGEIARFFKLSPQDVVVIYDELDLPPGKVKMKTGGGAGGHNGIRSIDSHIGKDYRRVRLGIGHPGDKSRVHSHVLGDFAKRDQDWLDPLLDAVARHAPLLAEGSDSTFMNKVHLDTQGSTPASKPSRSQNRTGMGQSHIRQARPKKPSVAPPKTGPMADMLAKLLGKN